MSSPTTSIAILGACGRMGRRLVALTLADASLALAAATESAEHPLVGQNAAAIAGASATGAASEAELAVTIASSLPSDPPPQVLIDFTAPAATRAMLPLCAEAGVAMVIGTTGLNDEDHRLIDQAAERIAVLQAPNMSLGVNLLFALAGQVAARLGDDYDIEITEAHHRFKKDAPSGTALGIAEAICQATGKTIDRDVVYDRHGDDVPRQPGQIGMHALRLGDVVGRHTASFATLGEELQLTHIASNRDVFAHGALKAAAWLAGKPAGRYGMADVLGFSE